MSKREAKREGKKKRKKKERKRRNTRIIFSRKIKKNVFATALSFHFQILWPIIIAVHFGVSKAP